MKSFSERKGLKPVREGIQTEGMSDELRNSLWNALQLFERKERESLDKLYGLLSETGAHPYMAESDQARLLRQLALPLTQFVLLRLESALKISGRGGAT